MPTTITPWWDCLELRPEIAEANGNINDVQMSLYHAVYEPSSTEYADVSYYSDITHPTKGLLELMASIAVRLAASSNAAAVKPVWRGDQGMGGGKSHAEVGLFHMANNPKEFFGTDLGQRTLATASAIGGETLAADLGDPTVVVLPCDRMDPFNPDKDVDNIAETLGQRWLWRLVDGDLDRYKQYRDGLGSPTGITAAIDAVGGVVLTLVDEVLSYVRKATATADQTRAQQDMAFLRDLMDATNTSDHAALVVVMIASDADQVAMGDLGEAIRTEMEGMLTRYGRSIATTSGGDFAEIIRRRLFVAPPSADVLAATVETFKRHATGGWKEQFKQFNWWTDSFADDVARSYPFHPAIVDLIEREWASRAGFQRVRSTIQIFAAAVHTWMNRASQGEWAPPLIGLGDLPLSDTKVRHSILDSGVIPDTKVITNYREIAANDVVDPSDERGAARRIDLDRASGLLAQTNPRAAERIATAMYLASLAPRSQGASGATEAELRIAAFVPDASCDLAEIDAVLQTLELPDKGIATLDVKPGKGGQPRRLMMSTTQTLQMFFRTQRQSVLSEDTASVLRKTAQAEMSKGPFGKGIFVNTDEVVPHGAKGADLTAALVDALKAASIDADETRLVVLDSTSYTLLNGVDSECRTALRVALGLGAPTDWPDGETWPGPMSVVYPSSCVFAVVNTYRRNHAVAAATDLVAWQRVADIPNVSSDKSLLDQAKSEIADKHAAVRTNLRKAYQHIVYLGDGREMTTVRLDKDNQSALDGTLVWKTLAERDKAFDKGDFDKTTLLFQLRDNDYGKSLSTIRADFYRSTRLPLLYDGDTDLRNAIFEAVSSGDVVVLNSSGEQAVPARPADINLGSTSNVLERPVPVPVPDLTSATQPSESHAATTSPSSVASTPQAEHSAAVSPSASAASPEARVTLTLMGSAFDDPNHRFSARQLFNLLGDAIDEGNVSYGKFQIEVTVPQDVADEAIAAAEELGLNPGRTDV